MMRKLWFHIIICIAKSEQVWSIVEIFFLILYMCSITVFFTRICENSDENMHTVICLCKSKQNLWHHWDFWIWVYWGLFSQWTSLLPISLPFIHISIWEKQLISQLCFFYNKSTRHGPSTKLIYEVNRAGLEQGCGWFECSSFGSPNTWQKFSYKVPEITTYDCKDKESHEIWQAMGLSLFLLPFLSVPLSCSSNCRAWR